MSSSPGRPAEPLPLPADLLAALSRDFPEGFATPEPAELAEFGKDWTKVFAPHPGVVCFPRSTDEVSRLLSLCDKQHVAVVPSGGRTGLAGGAVAAKGEVVLSLARMRR